MEIMLGFWIGLLSLCNSVLSQSSYDSRYIQQQVQYDDGHPHYNSHQSRFYPVNPHPSSPYATQPSYPQASSINSPYPQPVDNSRYSKTIDYSRPYNFYESPAEDGRYHSEPTYEKEPKKEVPIVKPPIPEEESPLYDSEKKAISAEANKDVEELQYSHDSGHDHHHQEPSRPQHPARVPHDPKLPLYFTMYEKRVIADPLDKFGKGPWRYMTYGHGITYGSKEPGKVFEKGYGYIRALGRDHCKNDKLCPYRDEKPFEYEGRKEPYFGYRPH